MIPHMSGWRMYRVMLTVRKRMKRMKFKRKTAVLSALEVLVFAPYGNSANRVETAPVPVETCDIIREQVYHHWDAANDRGQGGCVGNGRL